LTRSIFFPGLLLTVNTCFVSWLEIFQELWYRLEDAQIFRIGSLCQRSLVVVLLIQPVRPPTE